MLIKWYYHSFYTIFMEHQTSQHNNTMTLKKLLCFCRETVVGDNHINLIQPCMCNRVCYAYFGRIYRNYYFLRLFFYNITDLIHDFLYTGKTLFFRIAGDCIEGYIKIHPLQLRKIPCIIAAAVIFCFPVIEIFKKSKLYASEKSKNITTVLTTVISAILLLVSSIMLVDATTNPFLYFRF